MIINAKKRLTAASSYSWFNSYPPVKWEDKEKMTEILQELQEKKEGDSMTTVEGGIVLGNTCFAMKYHNGWCIIYMNKVSKENEIIVTTSEFIKNCAKYLK